MKKLIFTLFCIAMIASVSIPFALPASASTTIYVPDDYSTIQAAVDAANPGDTIIVRDGMYTENVNVNKDHLTIKSENGAEATIVQAASPDDHVFEVTADYVEINGFTVKGGQNQFNAGIYLFYANYCNVSKNTVNNNYHGIYLYYSNENIIVDNTASNNMAHGIPLLCSSNNTITGNNASNNVYGISLTWSSNNTVTDNNILDNKEVGILINSISNENIITDNTISNNYQGVCITSSNGNSIRRNNIYYSTFAVYLYQSENNHIYVNNFGNNAYYASYLPNTWNSPEKITYTYNGKTYTSYLGNCWSDYTGTDINGNGIGDTPYVITTSEQDNYPLMEPFENYHEFFYIGKYTATAYAYPEEADSTFGSFKSARTMITIQKPNSSTISVNVKKKFLDAMKMNGGGLVNSNPQSYVHLVQWTLSGNIFKEIEEVVGSQLIPIVAYQSIAKCPTDTKIQYGDEGFFTLGRTGTSYEYSVDDTCPACCKKGNGIDFWLGVGKAAYSEAFNWGKKTVDLYAYK